MIKLRPDWALSDEERTTEEPASRRNFIKAMAGTSAALASTSIGGAAAAPPFESSGMRVGPEHPGEPLQSRFLTFDNEWDRFEAIMRITRSIEDAADVLFWYHHITFAVPINSSPLPVSRAEGAEFTRHERVAEDQYLHHGHNLSYPRDLKTGSFSNTAVNPVTGRTITVPGALPDKLGPTHLLTPKGVIWTGAPSSEPVMGYYMIQQQGPYVVCDRRREEPHYAPPNFMETSFERVSWSDYQDKSIQKLPAITNGSFIWPYPSWMEMGDKPGHMLTTWSGVKLDSIDEVPTEFRTRMEKEYPHRMQVDRTAFREWKSLKRSGE